MWGRLEALRPFPSSPAVAGTPGRGGAGRAWGWASSLFRPEQLPQPDILLLGEGYFWEELMPRAVSERTWLWPNQGHSIHPLASNFEMKQAACLQGAKPQPPCGARRPLTMWRWSPHTPQSCPSGVLGRRTWISLLARPCPKNPWFPGAPLGNSYRPARGGVSPFFTSTQIRLAARMLQLWSDSFLYPSGIHPLPLVVFISDLYWGQPRDPSTA